MKFANKRFYNDPEALLVVTNITQEVFQHHATTQLAWDLSGEGGVSKMEWESVVGQMSSLAVLARLALSPCLKTITQLLLQHCESKQRTPTNCTRVALLLLLQGYCLVDVSPSTSVLEFPYEFDLTPGPCKSLLLECVDERELDVVTQGVAAALRWAEVESAWLLDGRSRERALYACEAGAEVYAPFCVDVCINSLECLVWFLATWSHCYLSPRGLIPGCHNNYKYREGTQASQNLACAVLNHLQTFILWWPRLQLTDCQQPRDLGERLANSTTRALSCVLSRLSFVNATRGWGGWSQFLRSLQSSELPIYLVHLPKQFGGSACQNAQYDSLAVIVRGLFLCPQILLLSLAGQWLSHNQSLHRSALALSIFRGSAHSELMEKPKSECVYFFLESIGQSGSCWLLKHLTIALVACCHCLQAATWEKLGQVNDWNDHLLRILNKTEVKTDEEEDDCLEQVIILQRLLWKSALTLEQRHKVSYPSAGRRCLLSLVNLWPHVRHSISSSVDHRIAVSSVVSKFYQLIYTVCTEVEDLDEGEDYETLSQDANKADARFKCKIVLEHAIVEVRWFVQLIEESIQIVSNVAKTPQLESVRSCLIAGLRSLLTACLHCKVKSDLFCSCSLALIESLAKNQRSLDVGQADILAILILLSETTDLWLQKAANRLQIDPRVLAPLFSVFANQTLSTNILIDFRAALWECLSIGR